MGGILELEVCSKSYKRSKGVISKPRDLRNREEYWYVCVFERRKKA
jgi:hypothetical protein